MVVPSESGGVHIRVSPMHMPEGEHAAMMPDVISTVVDKSPYVSGPSDLRLWVNAVTRLVARTLEDDLYESWKATTLPNRPAIDNS